MSRCFDVALGLVLSGLAMAGCLFALSRQFWSKRFWQLWSKRLWFGVAKFSFHVLTAEMRNDCPRWDIKNGEK
jgi:hypothetical protein